MAWLNDLPQLLKKLGNTSLETSSLIFDVLGHMAAKKMLNYKAKQLFGELMIFVIYGSVCNMLGKNFRASTYIFCISQPKHPLL